MSASAFLLHAVAFAATTEQASLSPAAAKVFDEAYGAMASGRLPEALDAYEKAVELAPDSWDIWLEYTSALRQAGFLQKAARAGWRTVELGPDRVDSWNNLSNVLIAANALTEALEVAEQMAQRFPKAPQTLETFTNLGYGAWTLKDYALAERSLMRALQLEPGHILAKVDLAAVHLSAGQPGGKAELEKALAAAKKASDANGVKWAEILLATAKEHKGVLGAPYPPTWAAEELTSILRTRPKDGTAAALPIENPIPSTFLLKRLGTLQLAVPDGWWESREGSKQEIGFLNLEYRSPKADTFLIKISGLIPPDGPKSLKPELAREMLESQFGKSGARLNWIPLAHGAMVWSKDPSWKPGKPGDYPHLLSAQVEVGPVWVIVSAFWGESPAAPPKEFLDLVSSLAWTALPNP
ncbi:MAG: tetratricopeptide repeat protein [Acidobacteriota bacterium]